jgi:LacI family transcriptional regulator
MTTIIDVAKKAGVSIKTVSRVMNNQANVRDETRRRVRQAMDELNYTPSDAARQMRSRKSRAIGMLYGDPSSGYQSRLNHAMMQACSQVGRYLAVGLFDEKKREWKSQLEAFLDRTKVESVVLVPPMCDSSILQQCLIDRGAQFVLLSPSHSRPGVAAVSMDDSRAALEMTQYLLKLGHRRIGHIAGHPDHIASLLRRQGFEEAILSAGLDRPDKTLVVEGRFNFRLALASAEKMLSSKNRPTAVFAASDDMAAAVYMAAGRLGLNVPEQVSIVGFDDVPIAQTIWPALTTVAQPFEKMALEAVGLLSGDRDLDAHSDASETIVVPHKIVVRKSCAKPPKRIKT